MGPKISKLAHVTQDTPIYGSFYIPYAGAGSVLRLCTEFETDCSICSEVIKGVPKLGHVTPATPN